MIDKKVLDTINVWKAEDKKVILVTGVFDVLHLEHLRFLNKANKCGDRLVVGLERDIRVKKIKGNNRPFYGEAERMEQLSYIGAIDLVFLLPEKFDKQEDWEKLMDMIRPNVYAVSRHTKWLENKRFVAEKYGARLEIVHDHNPKSSTTILLKEKYYT